MSSPVDSQENQESPDLENLDNSSADELLDDREEKLRNLESETAKPEGKIKQLTMETANNNSLQAKVFTIRKHRKILPLALDASFPRCSPQIDPSDRHFGIRRMMRLLSSGHLSFRI